VPGPATALTVSDSTLLVRPDIAMRQAEADRAVPPRRRRVGWSVTAASYTGAIFGEEGRLYCDLFLDSLPDFDSQLALLKQVT